MQECCTHSIKSSPCLSDDCPVISSNINTPSWNITFPHSSSAHDPTRQFSKTVRKAKKDIESWKEKEDLVFLPSEQASLVVLGWLCVCLLMRMSVICKREISAIEFAEFCNH